MPTSIKLQEEFGEDLQVIFVESQGADRAKMEGFALRKKWFGTTAMWTTERPFDSGSRGLPNYVLIGADGKVQRSVEVSFGDGRDIPGSAVSDCVLYEAGHCLQHVRNVRHSVTRQRQGGLRAGVYLFD